MGHRSILRGAIGAACVVLCLTVSGCDAIAGRTRSFSPTRGPVIAVLGQAPPRVMLLDANDLEEVGAIPLRSQSIGMAAVGDTLVTAQCGGVGNDSDTRVGFLRPFAGTLDYLDIGAFDPEEVWAAADQGWCIVLNGLIDADGMRCERVNVEEGAFEPLSIPAAGQAGAGAGEYVWILRKGVNGERDVASEDFYVFGREGSPRVVSSGASSTLDIVGFEDFVVSVEATAGGARLVRREAAEGAVLGDAVFTGIEPGPGCAWSAGDVLVLADYTFGEGRAVRELTLVNPETLSPITVIEADGLGAVSGAGEGRLVVCEADGDVILYASADGSMIAGTRIEGREEELLEAAYLAPADVMN